MAKKKKAPKTLPTPDIVKKRMIKGAIRRVFRQSSEVRECLNRARVELPPKTLKNGELGKKNQVRYTCAKCKQLFSQKNVQVDHINPVIELHLSEDEVNIDYMATRIWCDIDNLQVLCSTKMKMLPIGEKSCHSLKTGEENYIRDKWKELSGKGHELININKLESMWKQEYVEYEAKRKESILEKHRRKIEKQIKKAKK
jgi:hypothetical protein